MRRHAVAHAVAAGDARRELGRADEGAFELWVLRTDDLAGLVDGQIVFELAVAAELVEALEAYTMGAAYSAFSENSLGSLEPGKLADIVVVDRNLFDSPPNEINSAQVDATIVGGKVTTARRMAEAASDLICRKLGVEAPCRTATEALPGAGARREV